MTLEELQTEVETLKSHNAKLLGELKVAKAKAKGADIDPEAHAQLQNEVDELRSKLDAETRKGKSDNEKLTKALAEKDGALQSYLIDGGLSDALAKAGVKPEFMDAAKALLKQQAAIKSDGGQYQAVIGDKALSDAIGEWAGGVGKHFIAAPSNSGGGANGSTNSGATVKRFGDMSSDERVALYRQNPVAYEAAKAAG